MGALLQKINSRKLTYTSPLKTHLHLLFHAESYTLQFCGEVVESPSLEVFKI